MAASKSKRRRGGGGIYVVSVLLHAGVALAVARIERPELHEATSVTVREVKRTPKKAEPPPPPPPPVTAPKTIRRAPKAAAPPPVAPPPAAAPTAEANAGPKVADFGLSMSGSVGGGGIAVPLGSSTRAAPQRVTRTITPRALNPGKLAPAHGQDECVEALIKPKPIATPQPAYADRAREAGIQGKVRVELTVDANGAVVSARVLESLGYGLDEAALEAAKSWRFEPATRCGKSTATTFVVGIRFTL